ncbi:MAG: hypothetical protein ACXW30_05995 [Micavibrio sp.]
MANKLLMQGHASIDELLHASFGEWPPKGLDIVGTNNQQVNLMSLWKMANHLDAAYPHETGLLHQSKLLGHKLSDTFKVAGRATLVGERVIGINKLTTTYLNMVNVLLSGRIWSALTGKFNGVHATLAHESAHILQGDHYYRAQNAFGSNNAQNIWRNQKDVASNEIAKRIFDQHQAKPSILTRLFDKVSSEIDSAYYKQGIEIQARLHEIVTDGYQRWGKLPQNRAELFAAMKNSGFKLPESIRKEMEQSPDIDNIRRIFSGWRVQNEAQAVSDITFAEKLLTAKGRVEFWDKAMPELYSDLIEMYGDSQGRARFGLGMNDFGAMRQTPEFAAAQQTLKQQNPVQPAQ